MLVHRGDKFEEKKHNTTHNST